MAEMSKFEWDPKSITLTAPVCTALPDSPTWGQFIDGMKALAAGVEARLAYAESVVKSLDTRGKGRLDLMQTRQVSRTWWPERCSRDKTGQW